MIGKAQGTGTSYGVSTRNRNFVNCKNKEHEHDMVKVLEQDPGMVKLKEQEHCTV